jgi:hypothetical protein
MQVELKSKEKDIIEAVKSLREAIESKDTYQNLKWINVSWETQSCAFESQSNYESFMEKFKFYDFNGKMFEMSIGVSNGEKTDIIISRLNLSEYFPE